MPMISGEIPPEILLFLRRSDLRDLNDSAENDAHVE